MIKFYKLLFAAVIPLTAAYSYSVPLNGTYTIGATGDYTTLTAATTALHALGVSGPVVMKIKPGTYNEQLFLNFIPGTSDVNRVTFESLANDPATVTISDTPHAVRLFDLDNGVEHIVLRKLTLGNVFLEGLIQDVSILDNIFSGASIEQLHGSFSNLSIQRNNFLSALNILLRDFISTNLTVTENTFVISPGKIDLENVAGVIIAKNRFASIMMSQCSKINIQKNNIIADFDSSYAAKISYSDSIFFANNFVVAYSSTLECLFHDNNHSQFIFNSFMSEGPADTTVTIQYDSFTIVRNNIFTNSNGGTAITLRSLTGFDSDYNNYYNGNLPNLIRYNNATFNTLVDYISASGNDGHSVSHNTQFMAFTDLHLQMSESGDEVLACLPNPLVTTDIDGEPRSLTYPYMGADELDAPLPVELSSFTSAVSVNNVRLMWTITSETNNRGFEVERSAFNYQLSMFNVQWNEMGFIQGNGTTSSSINYEFVDRNLSSGKYKYRLKQIDFNGGFVYHELSNDVIIGLPIRYSLSQNYPNPFNPATKINYDLPVDSKVSMILFDISGKEVAKIVNEIKTAGYYTINFNGSDHSSGVYIYRLTAEGNGQNFIETKKMILVK